MIGNAKRVYALAGFTVEVRPRGLFYKKTYSPDDDWHGPYSSVASVTLMIARQLGREIKKRDEPHQLPQEASTSGDRASANGTASHAP